MKQYSKYKSTKTIWYPEIPENWVYCKVKHVANTYAGGTPSTVVDSFWANGNIPWLPSGKLQNCEITTAEKFITEDGLSNSSTKWIKPNTVLVALTGATCANIGYLTFQACANQSVVAIDENSMKLNSRFLYYTFLNMRSQILTHQTGGAQAGINDGDVKNLYLLKPSLEEQNQIAAFLDYKTNLIDATIEKKKRLIELLKEKRQAVISEAVTKGLNPNAPLKDSGVEWLGEIPEHWEVKKLKYSVDFISDKASNINRGIALEDITSWTGQGKLRDTSHFEGDLILFEKGDVLFSKLRPYLAKVYMAIEEGGAVGELMVLRPKLNIINQTFLYNRLISKAFIDVVDGSTYGAKMPRASTSFVLDLKFGVPPLKEQLEINEYINNIIISSNKLSAKLEIAIEKLQTYRQSLISEAVTGKIDVRDWAINN